MKKVGIMRLGLFLFSLLISGCAGQSFNRVQLCITSDVEPKLSCKLAIVDLDALRDVDENKALIIMSTQGRLYITTMDR